MVVNRSTSAASRLRSIHQATANAASRVSQSKSRIENFIAALYRPAQLVPFARDAQNHDQRDDADDDYQDRDSDKHGKAKPKESNFHWCELLTWASGWPLVCDKRKTPLCHRAKG